MDALVPLARALAADLDALRPRRLVTHAYEGGHPDHDAAAFVARAALDLLRRSGRPAPRLLEMALYHGAPARPPRRPAPVRPAAGAGSSRSR